MTLSVSTVPLCASMTLFAAERSHYFSWIILPVAKIIPRRLLLLSAALQKVAFRPAVHLLAAKRQSTLE